MDPAGLLNEIQEATTLRQAFDYAIFERINRSHFFDHFEIAAANSNRDELLSHLEREFADVEKMVPGRAYAYFPPKSELCFRRMINLPFKDLVIRNAVCIVLAKYLDPELCSECFANRRARGEDAATSLTADYAKRSWPNFCDWQFENANESQVLLVTDVSTFYDSVSHSYLMETLSSLLGIPEECSVMSLVKRFCQPSVEAYMELTQTIGEPKVVQQGLLTGNETEGILANLFLKPVDDDMLQLDVVYGRYNDDIRIFGDNLREVERAGLVLQQALLSRGLNLNAKKTEMAEGPEKMKALISRTIRQHRYGYEYEYGFGEFAYPNWSDPESVAESDTDDLLKKIDRRFEDFDREFQQDEKLCKHKDALEFCKFLAMADGVYDQRKALSIREEWHVDRLVEIPDRARIEHPLLPGRLVGMGLQHLFLLRQHELVVEQQTFGNRVHAEEEGRKIGRGIDRQRQHAEPQRRLDQRGAWNGRAPAAQEQTAAPGCGAGEEERKAGQHGDNERVPFGAHGETQRDTGQCEPPASLFGLADRGGIVPCREAEEGEAEDVQHRDARVDEQVEARRQQYAIGKRGKAAQRAEP